MTRRDARCWPSFGASSSGSRSPRRAGVRSEASPILRHVSVRVAFLGNDPWSVPALEAIAGEPDLASAIVVTNPPKPAGRGSRPTRTAVAVAADRLGFPLVEADRVGSGPGLEALLS